MGSIRNALPGDVSRIAEILVFTKRTNYRSIFQNDRVSFGEIQVLPLATELLENDALRKEYWVYEDEVVKGLVRVSGEELKECYVDGFFQGEGIGAALLRFAVKEKNVRFLWVLEKNVGARRFYRRMGFRETGERRLEEGTPEYLLRMERPIEENVQEPPLRP